MQEEKTREQLLEENARLRALLAQVREAYALLEVVVRDCPADVGRTDATVDSKADVKKLLKKYSRL